MEVYVFRHGAAEDGAPGRADSTRELTAEGREKSAAVVRMARSGGADPSLILSSPYARAFQTAKIAAERFGYKGEIVQTKALAPDSSPERVWNELREYHDEAAILLASHEPLSSRLAAYLLGVPALQIEMKKSAMVRIDLEVFRAAPQGILRWMITPKLTA